MKNREKVRLKVWIERKNASSNSTDKPCQTQVSVSILTVPSSNLQPQSLHISQLDREQIEYIEYKLMWVVTLIRNLSKYSQNMLLKQQPSQLREKKTVDFDDWTKLRMKAKTNEEYLKLFEQQVYNYLSSLNIKELAEVRKRTERAHGPISDESWKMPF